MGGTARRDFRDRLRRAEEAKLLQTLEYEGVPYRRMADDGFGLSRGTVLLGGRLVPGFPSIARIYVLEEGVRRYMEGPFVAEEKVDGYNVRVARHQGQLLAFTRGGWVCPFTTDRLEDLADLGPLFDEAPDAVVCAEVAGPENPYIPLALPGIEEDVRLFAFDLMGLDRAEPRSLEERDDLFQRHGVPQARFVGRYAPDEPDGLREEILRMDGTGVEGVVLKPLEKGARLKYVVPSRNLEDVVEDADLLAELPGRFFTDRIVRLVLGVDELQLDDRLPGMERRLGRRLIEGFLRALRQLEEEGVLYEELTLRVRREETIDRLLRHVQSHSRTVQVREVERYRDGPYWRLRFRKVFQRSTSHLKNLLAGQSVID